MKRVIALGTFDGVHTGHKALIEAAKRIAERLGAEPCVFTFDVHPAGKFRAVRRIMNDAERIEALRRQDIAVIVHPFEQLMELSPYEFVDMLIGEYDMAAAVVGYNYTFGKAKAGSAGLMLELGKRLGFEVSVISPVMLEDKTVSSTYLRGLIADGEVESANKMLTEPYSICGEVVSAKRIGTGIGFPTANIVAPDGKVLPKGGVYASRAFVNGQMYSAVTNVGSNPTVNSDGEIRIETHIIGFSGDIYGKTIKIEFLRFLRGEKKFESLQELKKQIASDVENALKN